MKTLFKIKYALCGAMLIFSSLASAIDMNVVSSKKRVFVLNEGKFEFTLDQLNTDKPVDLPGASLGTDTPVIALTSVLVAMKRGDLDAFKALNDPERLVRIESSLKTFNMKFSDITKSWEKSFKKNIYISHRIQYKKYVMFVIQRAPVGEAFVRDEDESTLVKSDLFAMENVAGKWRLTDGPKNDPVFCCWYTRTGKPELTLK
jgi:hypothetical protein